MIIHQTCPDCQGTGGHDTRPRCGGDRWEDDTYYWVECGTCSGQGDLSNPQAHVILRRSVPMSDSWWRRLAHWGATPVPAAKRCRHCGCITHRALWCPVCWGRR